MPKQNYIKNSFFQGQNFCLLNLKKNVSLIEETGTRLVRNSEKLLKTFDDY